MTSTILYQYCDTTIRKFIKSYKIVLAEPGNENNIHALRVRIKRIKAFLKYLQRIDPEFNYNKTYQPWRHLFKNIGQYRTMQVLIRKSKDAGHALTSNEELAVPDSKELYFDRKACKTLLESTGKIKNKGLTHATKKYLQNRFLKIRKLIEADPEIRELKLHILRKLFKEIHYNLKFLRKDNDFDLKVKKLDKWLIKTMKLLGKWHDNKLILKELNYKNTKQNQGSFKEAIYRENEGLLLKINGLLDNRKNVERFFNP